MKDHLGNVRLTFTAKEEKESVKATLETANAAAEESQFLYYDEAIKVDHVLFDHTNAGPTYYATRLTGGNTNAKFGLTKTLSLMPGDVVNMDVYAKYLDPTSSNWTMALNSFIALINGGSPPAGSIVDGGAAGSIGGGTYPIATINHTSESGTPPKAYLNYVVLDKSMENVLDMGYARITGNSREYGQDAAHDHLVLNYTAKEPGYIYIYISNENPTAVEVYFDDFKVIHTKSPVVGMEDYYPFGLTYNAYSRENSVDQKFKFQGQEHIDGLNLDWVSFKWRNHMPDIGRFFNVDPLAESFYYNSPYAFSENKVTNHIELEGLEAYPAQQALNQEIKKVETVVMNGVNTVKQGVSDALSWLGDKLQFTKDIPKEEPGGQQKGIGINIFDKGNGGPDNKYAPSPDPNSKNFDLEKSVLDALSTVSESPKAPSPEDIGQKMENVATAIEKANGAADAAKNALGPDKVKDDTTWTGYGRIDGKDSTTHRHFYKTSSGQTGVIEKKVPGAWSWTTQPSN